MGKRRNSTLSAVLLVIALVVGCGALLFLLGFLADYIARKRQEQAEATGTDIGQGAVAGVIQALGNLLSGKSPTDTRGTP